ncbi:MAG: hypothetical protein OEW46_09480 [Actinomycetota bacterium]|nr:hypothetical protein [Actinomycetota bacterium]
MRFPRSTFAAICLVLLIIGAAPTAAHPVDAAAPGVAGIDAWIVSGRKGPVGAGVRSPDGDGQTLTRKVRKGRTVTFTISAKRTGAGRSSVTFLGCAGAPGFSVNYRLPDGTVVTLDVTGRGYVYRQVDVGDVVRMRLSVDTTGSHSGNRAFCGVGAYTPDRGDVVGARVVIK